MLKRTTRLPLAAIGFVLATGGFSPFAVAQGAPPTEAARPPVEAKKPDYSPYPDQKFPNRVFWGVAHVHTGYSFDSGMFGVTTTPDDLFRVATGGEVVLDNGQRFKQDRPLDWVSITDHAEYMGISDQIRAGSPELLANPQGKRWYEMSQTSPQEGVKAAIEAVVSMQTGKPVFDASKLTLRPGRRRSRRPRSGIIRVFSRRCTVSSGPLRPAVRISIAPWSSATARTA